MTCRAAIDSGATGAASPFRRPDSARREGVAITDEFHPTLVESALAEIAEQRRLIDALLRREPEARSALARDAEAVR